MNIIKFYSKPGKLAFCIITGSSEPHHVAGNIKKDGFKGFFVIEPYSFNYPL